MICELSFLMSLRHPLAGLCHKESAHCAENPLMEVYATADPTAYGSRPRGSVGNAHQVTGPAPSGVAWDQAVAGRSWGTARPAMLAVQTSAR